MLDDKDSAPAMQHLPVSVNRIDAAMRFLVDQGEATPQAQRVMRKVTDANREASVALRMALQHVLLSFLIDTQEWETAHPTSTQIPTVEGVSDITDVMTTALDAITALMTMELSPQQYLQQTPP